MKTLKTFLLPFLLTTSFLFAETATTSHIKALDFSMVISGGVSLGAYESGYNWAMLKGLAKVKQSNKGLTPAYAL